MPRYIDADALKNELIECTPYAVDPVYRNTNSNIDMFTVMEMLDGLPIADAVPVVRCGECVYFDTDECAMTGYCEGCDCMVDLAFNSTGYCAKGKRGESEAKE